MEKNSKSELKDTSTTKANEILCQTSVFAWNHEPLSFRRRLGSACVDEEQKFAYEHTEEYVETLKKNGCDWLRLHFFKGFGLLHEMPEIEMAKELVKLCHLHGIRVQAYVQVGTLQYETFLLEAPEAKNWVQVDDLNRPFPLFYVGGQSFRWMPCYLREGYWSYLQKVLSIAIKEIGFDGIGFDNVNMGREPESCRCNECQLAFRNYLAQKYPINTTAQQKITRERFGFENLSQVRLPIWSRWFMPERFGEISDPLLQEYVQFRCESLAVRVEELNNYCKKISSETIVEFNFYRGWGLNVAFWHGVDIDRLLPHLDAFWNENDPEPILMSDGTLLHKTRSYKLGRQKNKFVFTGGRDVSRLQKRLNAVESL